MSDLTEITARMREAARDPDVPVEIIRKLLEITADHIEGQERAWEHAMMCLCSDYNYEMNKVTR
jgi:hypothetical protein